ncbi:MAG: phosphotransferase family protein [Actinomycetota bacterium]
MATGAVRADADLLAGLRRWSGDPGLEFARPSAGFSSETVVVTGSDGGRRVVRLPLLVASYPEYDLGVQAAVLDALGAAGMPVPRVLAREDEDAAVGAPFLVMTFVPGRPVADVPAFDPWIVEGGADRGRTVEEQFVDALGRLHRVDWRAAGLGSVLRVGLEADLAYWQRYVDWAADGRPARLLADAMTWCITTAPPDDPDRHALCWGDARLGNVCFDPDTARLTALLDWELATVGPPEADLAWYLALGDLTARFVGRRMPGALDRPAVQDRYEAALGRPVADLAWHEVFALVRSVAINDRQARLAAAAGVAYPGVAGDDNPVLAVLAERIDEHASRANEERSRS